jgi:S-adenosylmethionine-dependent methyltransferase
VTKKAGRVVARHVAGHYDRNPQREWERLERHRTEFAVTLRALEEHLPPPPADVLDCGGGPGRYAIELARRGYTVTLFDLSSECLRVAQEKAREAGVTLLACVRGTATDLSRFSDAGFDAVLLMGPLYHLLDEAERVQALLEVSRVLKPGGRLFAAFISRFAPLRYAAAEEPDLPLREPETLRLILDTGRLPPRDAEGAGFVAHFAHPAEIVPLVQQTGFEVLAALGVEGVVSQIEAGVNALSGEAWDTWVALNYRIAQDTAAHGGAEHLLVVAQKPRWPTVLAKVARELANAGLPYTLVGGASVALHGVPIRVDDLDIETDAGGAYAFQALFPDHVIEPVALRSSERYRSHFGRFDLDGQTIEVMGDLQRREGDGWAPTAARTQETLILDGASVRVSWLEEETLAYIRRGRLERGAQCLRRCNRERLVQLIRGERQAGVL